jgi:hypothetical protein
MAKAEARESGDRDRLDLDNISNKQIEEAIDLWIHSKRDRMILKLRLIDGLTYQQTSDYLYKQEGIILSDRRIKTIVYKAEAKLFKHI